jgi:hypothetical protein
METSVGITGYTGYTTPAGELLEWSLDVGAPMDSADGLLSFFIDWRGTDLHPAATLPRGCRLISLTLEHPQRSHVADSLSPLGLFEGGTATAGEAPGAHMVAVLDTLGVLSKCDSKYRRCCAATKNKNAALVACPLTLTAHRRGH